MKKLKKHRTKRQPRTAKSFGSALNDIGFKPRGRRIFVRAGLDRLPLRRLLNASDIARGD